MAADLLHLARTALDLTATLIVLGVGLGILTRRLEIRRRPRTERKSSS
jgi:hypothetical protein